MVKGTRPKLTPIRPREQVVLRPSSQDDRCAREREIRFAPEGDVLRGQRLHLVPHGAEVWIVGGTGRIGKIGPDPDLAACLDLGWAFEGAVERVETSTAIAVVRGYPTR